MSQEPKKPINRKLTYLLLLGVGLVGILGIVVVSLNDPRQAREEKQREAETARIAGLPTGSEAEAQRLLEEAAAQASKEAEKEAQADRAVFDEFTKGTESGPGVPTFDPELLRQLDAAQRQVARKPDIGTVTGGALPGLPGRAGGAGASESIFIESYDKPSATPAGDMFGTQEAEGNADGVVGPDGVYETIKPQAAPSARVVNEGAAIHAVLMTRIDTRNAGPIKAKVTRTIYDTRTRTIALIPQGSTLVGAYATSVAPGVDRIPASFTRLILPDGRAFRLPQFPTAGLDGTIGVSGDYHSNILRAIGPSFVVAVLGQAVDREVRQEIPVEGSVTPGPAGGMYQSPSVIEKTMPKVNEAVMQRYQAAKPYFTAEPGQEIRVILTQDLEIHDQGRAG